MNTCRHCAAENEDGSVFCIQCGERVPDSASYTLRLMFKYIRSYEIINSWRFELSLLVSLALDAILYFSVLHSTAWLRVCVLILVMGAFTGFLWQWRNRYNL